MYWLLLFTLHATSYIVSCAYYLTKDLNTYNAGIDVWDAAKIQPYTHQIWIIWAETSLQSAKNLLVSFVFMAAFDDYFPDAPPTWGDLPRVFAYIAICDAYFYGIHRLLHTRQFYQYHKLHHATHLVVAASGMNMSLAEHIINNFGAICVPFAIVGGSRLLFTIMVVFSSINAAHSHSGYRGTEYHNAHHQMPNMHYGIGFHILDNVFGTR